MMTYLVFVIFFTLTYFKASNIYTQKCVNLRQKIPLNIAYKITHCTYVKLHVLCKITHTGYKITHCV